MSEKKLRAALKALLNHYVDLVKSGDAGIWNVEAEPVVKRARAALATPASAPVGETTEPLTFKAIDPATWGVVREFTRAAIINGEVWVPASEARAPVPERRDQEEGRFTDAQRESIQRGIAEAEAGLTVPWCSRCDTHDHFTRDCSAAAPQPEEPRP